MKPPIILLVLLLYHSYYIMKRNFKQFYIRNSKIEDSTHEESLHSVLTKTEFLMYHYKNNQYDSYLRNYQLYLLYWHDDNKSEYCSFLHNDTEHSKTVSNYLHGRKKAKKIANQDTKQFANDIQTLP